MKTISAHLQVPACWRHLVKVGDLSEATSEKTLKGVADPDPHYDDCRRLDGQFYDGFTFALELASSQQSYYGGLTIWDTDGKEIYSDTWDHFDPDVEEIRIGEVMYRLEYDWVENWAERQGVPVATKFVTEVTVIDPDTQMPVEVEIRKMSTGGMVGIDGSFLEQDIGKVYSPYDNGVELVIPDDEVPS